jgi:2,3-bisphosphoglycerate-independent phosphoglycerate mutase
MNKKVILMILDGWGTSPDPKVSAIDHAQTPYIDSLYSKYAHASLRTDGLHVGLPEGQMGNSEVGHMNLGAGRIVYQDLAKINLAVKNNTLAAEAVLENAIAYAKSNNKPIHLLGLVSDGGVHSHIDHLFGLIDALEKNNIPKGFVHAFTDGRDVDPKSGLGFISSLESRLKDSNVKLASVIGRYYAMDRDNRWERTKLAYDAVVHGIGEQVTNATASIKNSYANGITDEFIKPIIITDQNNEPSAKINEGDVVLFFNFRTDRGRQLTAALSQNNFPEYEIFLSSYIM